MKQLLFLFFFIVFSGIQVAHAEFMNMGSAEIIVLLITGLFTLLAIVSFIFLCLYLIKRSKSAQK